METPTPSTSSRGRCLGVHVVVDILKVHLLLLVSPVLFGRVSAYGRITDTEDDVELCVCLSSYHVNPRTKGIDDLLRDVGLLDCPHQRIEGAFRHNAVVLRLTFSSC